MLVVCLDVFNVGRSRFLIIFSIAVSHSDLSAYLILPFSCYMFTLSGIRKQRSIPLFTIANVSSITAI